MAQILLNSVEDKLIAEALEILKSRLYRSSGLFKEPYQVKRYLKLKLAELPYEVFGMLHLDSQHRLIQDEQLFRGTLGHTPVYPREVLRSVVNHNTANVIVYHNHPGGTTEPSEHDYRITKDLKAALKVIDVQVLDHFIVGGIDVFSFHEAGKI